MSRVLDFDIVCVLLCATVVRWKTTGCNEALSVHIIHTW